jgi:hypothetical protein
MLRRRDDTVDEGAGERSKGSVEAKGPSTWLVE